MNQRINKSTLIIASAANFLTSTSNVCATNGYWAHGYGPKSKSMAGACAAVTLEGGCNAINPATSLDLGNSMELNLSIFTPDHGFNANADGMRLIPPGEHESTQDFFFIPGFNYNRMLDSDSSIGLTVGGNGGMNTLYEGAVFSNFSPPGISNLAATSPSGMDLMQGFVGTNYTRRLNPHHTIGIMPFLAVQSLKVYGLEPFKMYSSDPDHVTGNGREMSYGAGVRVGWMGHINEQFTLGASYQTRSWMTKFDEYSGLLAEQGSFDIPSNYELGLAYKPTQDWTLAVDFQKIMYSDIKALSNSTDIPMNANFMPTSPLMGTDQGMGFGWNDVNVIKFGAQWHYNDAWTFRAGYSHADQAFSGSQAMMNILAPAVVRDHYTLGLSTAIDADNELSFALSYAPNVKLYGENNQVGGQSGYLYMDQWDFNIGWAWHL